MEQRITVVTLTVADVPAARRFYEAGLGWRPARGTDDSVAFYQAGGLVVALWGRADLAADAGLEAPPDTVSGAVALALNVDSREAVDRVVREAVAAGGRALRAPAEVFWGGYTGYFADPDGHVWEIAWNPGWPLGDDGSVHLPEA